MQFNEEDERFAKAFCSRDRSITEGHIPFVFSILKSLREAINFDKLRVLENNLDRHRNSCSPLKTTITGSFGVDRAYVVNFDGRVTMETEPYVVSVTDGIYEGIFASFNGTDFVYMHGLFKVNPLNENNPVCLVRITWNSDGTKLSKPEIHNYTAGEIRDRTGR